MNFKIDYPGQVYGGHGRLSQMDENGKLVSCRSATKTEELLYAILGELRKINQREEDRDKWESLTSRPI